MATQERKSQKPIVVAISAAFCGAVFIGGLISVAVFGGGRQGGTMVSREKADQRSLATALESYYVDHFEYPRMIPLRELTRFPEKLKVAGGWDLMTVDPGSDGLAGITTPVPYISTLLFDPHTAEPKNGSHATGSFSPYAYYASPDKSGWIVFSTGPDGDYDITNPAAVYSAELSQAWPELMKLAYDPTNGRGSNGDIFRVKQ